MCIHVIIQVHKMNNVVENSRIYFGTSKSLRGSKVRKKDSKDYFKYLCITIEIKIEETKQHCHICVCKMGKNTFLFQTISIYSSYMHIIFSVYFIKDSISHSHHNMNSTCNTYTKIELEY